MHLELFIALLLHRIPSHWCQIYVSHPNLCFISSTRRASSSTTQSATLTCSANIRFRERFTRREGQDLFKVILLVLHSSYLIINTEGVDEEKKQQQQKDWIATRRKEGRKEVEYWTGNWNEWTSLLTFFTNLITFKILSEVWVLFLFIYIRN